MAKPHASVFGNVAFFYLPFSSGNDSSELGARLVCAGWSEVEDKIAYLYPHVYKKRSSEGPSLLCTHFMKSYESDLGTNLLEVAPDGKLKSQNYSRQNGQALVIVHKMHCYVFETGINILSFEVSVLPWQEDVSAPILPFRDAKRIATWLNWLYMTGGFQKPDGSFLRRNRLRPHGMRGEAGETLLQMARKALAQAGLKDARLMEHMLKGNERAGVFVHVQHSDAFTQCMPSKRSDQIDEELCHLAALWDDVPFGPECHNNPTIHVAAPDIRWGISRMALACISYLSPNNDLAKRHYNFLKTTFARNVENEYQHMYVFLLHQKFVYLTWLSRLSQSVWEDIEALEDYKKRLEAFHADYVYAQVSDMTQYEMLYEKVRTILQLPSMEADIREPIDQLARLQHAEEKRLEEIAAEQDKLREEKLNVAMNSLALLSVVSALCDGWALIELFPIEGMHVPLFAALHLVVIGLAVWVLRTMRE